MLDRAIDAWEDAVNLTSPDSPDLAKYLNGVGTGRRARFDLSGNMDDLMRGLDAYETAVKRGLEGALEDALVAACDWGDWATQAKHWIMASEAYNCALEAMDRLFRTQLLRESKEAWLAIAQGVPARAAYALAKSKKVEDSVVVLERGRALLLAESLERGRADLEQLKHAGCAHLYERYRSATDRWNELLGMEQIPSGRGFKGKAMREALKLAQTDFDNVIADIRRVHGWERFLQPPAFEDIVSAAGNTCLVYICAASRGGLALILRPGRRPNVTPVWLPELTHENVLKKVLGNSADPSALDSYLGAYRTWRADPEEKAAFSAWLTALEKTTAWLWKAAIGPVIKSLRRTRRVTLVPSGLLSLLPLHAACKQDRAARLGKRYALDLLSFTCLPNARSLAASRFVASTSNSDKILAVDEPQPVDAPRLLNSASEVQIAVSTFSERRILKGGKATSKKVLKALSKCSVLHVSCHGFVNFAQPLSSGMVMAYDEVLDLRSILNLRLTGLRLAILSACETNIPGTQLPDEVVSLPTGLLQAGVAGVVAPLWAVSEASTLILLARFYDLWRTKNLAPAEALRKAQIWVRDTTNAQKSAYFRRFLPEFGSGWMPREAAEAIYQRLVLTAPKKREFSHPFHWAAFCYVGQ